ncbi:MAG TPA: hypothetical protein VFD63_21130 [Pyrinomonadaceae bacterium]|nr:hypothetical protein [Pyrinomonadaceae bacterium]
MKKTIRLIALGAVAALFALPVAAKSSAAAGFASQDQCTTENKDAWYAAFREERPKDQQKAYDVAKKYLGCVASSSEAPTDAQKAIIDYLKKWTTAYEEGSKQNQLPILIYKDKKYPEAYALGKELLAKDPENLKNLVDLGANGYLAAGPKNPSLSADALTYAKKAIQLLESGKTVDNWQPLSGKDEALAYLHYTVGYLTLETDPSAALSHLIKAAQTETPLKKSALTYGYIGGAYESGPYAKQSDAYKACCAGKEETPESKLMLANINQVVDRMIDAYARAVALAGNDPNVATLKTSWNENLTSWYKFRHNDSPAGLDQMVAGILSTPLPPEPTPITTLPASTPAATPIGNSSGSNDSAANSAPAQSGSKAPSTATGAAKPPATKAGTTTGPNKPR